VLPKSPLSPARGPPRGGPEGGTIFPFQREGKGAMSKAVEGFLGRKQRARIVVTALGAMCCKPVSTHGSPTQGYALKSSRSTAKWSTQILPALHGPQTQVRISPKP
jgi:hypothetical protein